ncbi:hypothetical protein EDC35_106201 [Thiobaca trueperi]|uniref:Uncharacterized protein n=1 Tax=Thiobaca trueperi TaxID=127458 RepID=A0A4R3MVC7_9GAMM|nr:hypothetical protein EDC35_106201 [Thiobaca trueperi]
MSPPLARTAQERIARAQAQIDGIRALYDLAEQLDPDLSRPWRAAGEIAERLRRFKTAWLRIQAGARLPRDDVETRLTAVLRGGIGCSRERIFKMLSD